jgi:hypothetical protein
MYLQLADQEAPEDQTELDGQAEDWGHPEEDQVGVAEEPQEEDSDQTEEVQVGVAEGQPEDSTEVDEGNIEGSE